MKVPDHDSVHGQKGPHSESGSGIPLREERARRRVDALDGHRPCAVLSAAISGHLGAFEHRLLVHPW